MDAEKEFIPVRIASPGFNFPIQSVKDWKNAPILPGATRTPRCARKSQDVVSGHAQIW
jgi:hypothetical protein